MVKQLAHSADATQTTIVSALPTLPPAITPESADLVETTEQATLPASPARRASNRANAIDLGLLFVVLVWGGSPIIFKLILQEMDPLAFVFVRFLLLSVFSVSVLFVRGLRGGRAWRIERRDILWLVISGLSGYGIYQLLYIEGLANTTVFASALMAATVPIWSAIILAALRIERVVGLQWLGIAISFGGVAWFLLAGSGHSPEGFDRALTPTQMLLGGALTLAAAALFAVYGIVNKRLAVRYSPPELMCYTLLIGTLALAPAGIPALIHQHWERLTWHSWLLVPYSVVFPIYLSYSIWNWAIGKRGVGYVTLFNYAVPVMAAIFGFLALGEALTLTQMAGGVLVIGGMLLARWAITGRRWPGR
ncbi:MAG TPA: DMT family transporter [Ktedonobacterales bacterium]|nr:DMT family transporter [Ktedonobacterales bacterium]